MFGYIVRRLVAGVLVLIAVSMMVFAIFFYGPNDPALAYCPESRCTPERLENISHNLGLDRPAPQQYVEYMSGLVKSRHIESGGISIDCNWPCLGVSFKYRVSVFDYLWERFPATLVGRRRAAPSASSPSACPAASSPPGGEARPPTRRS